MKSFPFSMVDNPSQFLRKYWTGRARMGKIFCAVSTFGPQLLCIGSSSLVFRAMSLILQTKHNELGVFVSVKRDNDDNWHMFWNCFVLLLRVSKVSTSWTADSSTSSTGHTQVDLLRSFGQSYFAPRA